MTRKLLTALAVVASITTAVSLGDARADHGGFHIPPGVLDPELIDPSVIDPCAGRGRCPGLPETGDVAPGSSRDRSDVAAGALGFVAGAMLGSAMAAQASHNSRAYANWLASCSARYRSFNPRTGMYLGYDGRYHPCR